MKFSLNLSVSKEKKFDKDNNEVLLNLKDEDKQSQNISLNIIDFNYKGSIQPLADLVMEWVKEKNKQDENKD